MRASGRTGKCAKPSTDWVRRFLAYLAEREGVPHPRVDSESVRDYLTHLAVRQRVSASTQNQALCAILFLCREVLGTEPEGLTLAGVRAFSAELWVAGSDFTEPWSGPAAGRRTNCRQFPWAFIVHRALAEDALVLANATGPTVYDCM